MLNDITAAETAVKRSEEAATRKPTAHDKEIHELRWAVSHLADALREAHERLEALES